MAVSRRATLVGLLATSLASPIVLARARLAAPSHPGGPMPAKLREEVDRLRRETLVEATGDANVIARAQIVYAWMNVLALRGIPAHPDLPAVVAQTAQPNFKQLGERLKALAFAAIDQSIRTLGALEDRPSLCGHIVADAKLPFVVKRPETFSLTYVVGDAAIKPGGGVYVPSHYFFDESPIQASDPTAENFISVRSDRPGARFVVAFVEATGMFSPRLASAANNGRVFFKLVEGELRRGDRVTVTFGDRSGGSPGFRMMFASNSALRFPLWVLTEPDGLLLTPPDVILPLVGGPVVGVRGFAPSIVASGEGFTVSIRAEDKYRNLASSAVPGWRILVNGAPFREVRASNAAVVHLDNVSFAAPGVYRFTVVSDDGKITGSANPVRVEHAPDERIYWGETHGHCGFSEGMGLATDYYRFARDEARLDFTALSEHDIWLDAGEWEAMRQASTSFNAPGRFITFMGYEWTVGPLFGGHHNVIFRNVARVQPVTSQRHPTLPDLYSGLRRDFDPKDVLVIPHAHITADATQNDRELEPLVEIASEHGTFEWLGQRYLANGLQLGFVGGDDNHIGHPGYKPRPAGPAYYYDSRGGLAAVFAKSCDRDPLFDAMKARRTYATNSERIILKVRANGAHMGEVLPPTPERTIAGVVHGTAPIASIALVRNGEPHRVMDFEDTGGAVATGDGVDVEFFSKSDAPKGANARAERIWEGRIIVDGAVLASAFSPQIDGLNTLTEWARISASDPQVVDFRLTTRGDRKAIRLTVSGSTAPMRLRVVLPAGRSRLDATIAVPGTVVSRDVDPGVSRNTGAGAFDDLISARRVRPATQLDREFNFVDRDDPHDGDYYYVRITQVDGGLAWSSPAWFGAPKKRT